jgi:hypothetical protein
VGKILALSGLALASLQWLGPERVERWEGWLSTRAANGAEFLRLVLWYFPLPTKPPRSRTAGDPRLRPNRWGDFLTATALAAPTLGVYLLALYLSHRLGLGTMLHLYFLAWIVLLIGLLPLLLCLGLMGWLIDHGIIGKVAAVLPGAIAILLMMGWASVLAIAGFAVALVALSIPFLMVAALSPLLPVLVLLRVLGAFFRLRDRFGLGSLFYLIGFGLTVAGILLS